MFLRNATCDRQAQAQAPCLLRFHKRVKEGFTDRIRNTRAAVRYLDQDATTGLVKIDIDPFYVGRNFCSLARIQKQVEDCAGELGAIEPAFEGGDLMWNDGYVACLRMRSHHLNRPIEDAF